MALTIEQGLQAGALANEAAVLGVIIARLQAAIGAGAAFEAISIIPNVGDPLNAALPLSAPDSATLMNAALAVYQAMLASVTAQLQAMGS